MLIAAAAALLAVATAAIQLGPWRYQPAPGTDVALDDYRTAGAPWFTSQRGTTIERGAEAPGIEIAGGPRLAYAARWIRPAPGIGYTRVSLDVALDDVVRNSRDMGAMIAVVSFGHAGQRLTHWPRELFNGDGRQGWRHVSLAVPWSDEVARMRLELVNAGESGTLKLRHIAIAALVDAPWYPWAHRGLVVAWSLLGLTAVTLALRHGRPRRAAFAVTAAALFIAIGGVLPEPLFDRLAAPMEEPLVTVGRALVGPGPSAAATPRPKSEPAAAAAPAPRSRPPESGTTNVPSPEPPDLLELSREAAGWARRAVSHNVIHAGGFGGLALLVAFWAPPVGVVHLAGLAGFAAVTEILQVLTVTRGANLEDVAVDCLSALPGLALGIAIRLALARRRDVARR